MADDMMLRSETSALLTFTSDETEIMDAAHAYMSQTLPLERLHGAGAPDLSPELRVDVGQLGWYGLALPEADGGSGLSAVEQALFFREVGRQCGPLDILTQALAVTVASGDEGLRSALLSGEEAAVLAVDDGVGFRLLGAPSAAHALHVDRAGATLFKLAGAELEIRPSLDPATTMRLAPDLGNAVGRRPGEAVWASGQVSTAAMLVGLAEATLDLIVEFARVRETFGRKIGAYQAVRHPCADMAVRLEAARAQLWYAVAALKGGRGDAQAHLDAAKHLANEAATANADTNIQLHGGIGVTDEHHAHLMLKRALLLRRLFGGRRDLLDRLLHARLED